MKQTYGGSAMVKTSAGRIICNTRVNNGGTTSSVETPIVNKLITGKLENRA